MTARPTSGPGSGAAWPRNPADGQTVQDLLAELGNTELTKGWLPAPAVKETPGPADPGWSGTRNQQSLTRWNQLPGLRFQGHLGQRHANRLVRFWPVLIATLHRSWQQGCLRGLASIADESGALSLLYGRQRILRAWIWLAGTAHTRSVVN